MRHMVIASHAHFAAGISEALSFLGGGAGVDIKVICAFVDGKNDIAQAVADTLAEIPAEDEVLVCTDIFGGSVNNEFTNVVQQRENIHLVTNMNLPLLISLLFSINEPDLAAAIRAARVSAPVQATLPVLRYTFGASRRTLYVPTREG